MSPAFLVDEQAARLRLAREHDFALVVGVDHYPRFRSLQGAVADATAFHGWVCDPGGGAVDPSRARLIVSKQEPAAPVQDQIDKRLLELMIAADQLGGGRRLYFYFSGHGAMSPEESGDDVALLLATWSKHLRFALSSRGYSSKLGSVGIFEELVIFLDCCRTATVRSVGQDPVITYDEMTSQRCPTRTFIAYATEAGRTAFEQSQGELWRGVFTRCLLTILRRSPGGTDARALKDQLECEVREARTGQQAHVINGLLDGARFGRQGVVPQLRITFCPGRGRVQLVDGVGELVAEHDATSGPWLISTRAGLYKLADKSGACVLVDHGRTEMTDVAF